MDERIAKRLIKDLEHVTTGANVHDTRNFIFAIQLMSRSTKPDDVDLLKAAIEQARVFLINLHKQKYKSK